MVTINKRLTVLSEAEHFALYGLPDFNDSQRMQYLFFSDGELSLVFNRPGISAQVHCALQIGYFKAKHAFFQFSWEDAEEELSFILSRYFNSQLFDPQIITRHEYYTQRKLIADFFGYHLWSNEFVPQVSQHIAQVVLRDVTPGFIVAELIPYLNEHKIVRPGYTTLQTLISEALSNERNRLFGLIAEILDESTKSVIGQLLIREDTLSGLAALKQDAKHFGYRQMIVERKKHATLEPIYQMAKKHLPRLAISLQNLNYYASLANFYTIYDLRRMRPEEQTYLYLLCYAWLRYRQLTDNLIDAAGHHMKQFENEIKIKSNKIYIIEHTRRQQETQQVGRLLLIGVMIT